MPQSPTRQVRACMLSVAVIALLNAVAAAAGGVCLAIGVIDIGAELTPRLPWGSAILGGIALVLVVAVPNTILTVLAWHRDRRTGAAAVAVGALLIAWILIELAFIRELSFFHPLYVVIGIVMITLGARLLALVNGVPAAALAAEVRDVVVDLPVFATTPLYRHWHRRWGTTEEEASDPLPGDELLAHPSFSATRAIDIAAPPEEVWPWLVQVGCLRAGFYSDDLLDNLGHPSAREIEPQLQHLVAGSLIPMSPHPSVASSFCVMSFDVPRWLLWGKHDSTWSWSLSPTPDQGTRLVTRLQATYDWHHPMSALAGKVLLEFGDFAMQRRMLRGIRDRAEAHRPIASDVNR